jgi:hypothetical protein
MVASCYDYYIRRGAPGSEQVIIDAMNRWGWLYLDEENYDSGIEISCLNCGNEQLESAAAAWAGMYNCDVVQLSCSQKSMTGGGFLPFSSCYCRPGAPFWGSKPFQNDKVYTLCPLPATY